MSRKYLHQKNSKVKYIDWREPDRRMMVFLIWLNWRLKYNDLDHYMVSNCYRDADGKMSPTKNPMTKEQALWYCLIFGCTYQTEMAWVIYWNFPNFWEIDLDEMQKWNVYNLKIQKYARDTKYNKGRIVDQVRSMREIIKPYGSIEAFVNKYNTFELMYEKSQEFYKFGRMTGWLLCQALYETGEIKTMVPPSMLATDKSNWSVRSGLCYLYGRDDLIEAKTKKSLSKYDMELVGKWEKELFGMAYDFIDKEFHSIFSYYLLESHLCQYKKLMLGGDYAGHSSGDHYSRASWLKERWNCVNFDAFFKVATYKYHPLVRNKKESPALRHLCAKTGQLINMHLDHGYLPDMYVELGITSESTEQEIVDKIDVYKNKTSGDVGLLQFIEG